MTKNEKFLAVWHLYESEHGHAPARARDAVDWGVAQGMLEVPHIDPYQALTAQMSKVLGEEFDTHKGHRYRVNHAVRVTHDGVQQTFWGVMGFADHAYMEQAFSQRREHIIGECVQLNTDVLVYNDMNQGNVPIIQMVLDFTEDVAERSQNI